MVNSSKPTSPSIRRASSLCALLLVSSVACSDHKPQADIGSAVGLLVEDFESDPWGTRWERKDRCAEADPEAARSGNLGLRLSRACWIHTLPPIRTVGYEAVRVAFDYRAANLEPDERVDVLWSLDRERWTLVRRAAEGQQEDPYALGTPDPESGWAQAVVQLPSQTFGQEQLYIRIDLAVNGGGDERLDLDNIELRADPIAACDHAALCAAQGAECGVIQDDTCGDVPCDVPGCTDGRVCVDHRCQAQLDCTPETRCAEAQAQCGTIFHPTCGDIDCGGALACGEREACVDNRCEPQCGAAVVCAGAMAQCGSVTDPICGTVECGGCAEGETCETTGAFNRCVPPCTPLTCEAVGAACGTVPDGCGGTLDCGGGCAGGLVCGADHACIAPGCEDLPVNASVWFRAELCNDAGACADLSGRGHTTAPAAQGAPARVVAQDSGKHELRYGPRSGLEIHDAAGCTEANGGAACESSAAVSARTVMVVARKRGTAVAYLDLTDHRTADGKTVRRALYFADARVYYWEVFDYGGADSQTLSSLSAPVPDDELLILTVASSPLGNALYVNGVLVAQDSQPAQPSQFLGLLGFVGPSQADEATGIAEYLAFDHLLAPEVRDHVHATLASRYSIEGVGLLNVAPLGVASQSSTSGGAIAARAVDGDTDGDWKNGSVTHTQAGAAWWELDLLSEMPVRQVVLYNRTDCCGEKLAGFTLQLLDADRKVVASSHVDGPVGARVTLPFLHTGRYVRIDHPSDDPLSLAEVEVMVPAVQRAQASGLPLDAVEAWFRADAVDLELAAGGDRVRAWRSKPIGGGATHVLRTPTEGVDPTFVPSQASLGDQPAVWFGAGADTILEDATLAPVVNDGKAFSVVAVVDRASAAGEDVIWSARDAEGVQVLRWMAYPQGTARRTPPYDTDDEELRFTRSASGATSEVASTGAVRPGAPIIVSEVFDGTTSSMGLNGGRAGAATASVTPDKLERFFVGGDLWSGDPITEWSGAIAELIVFKRALSAEELGRVEQYLAARYALGDVPDVVARDAAAWLRADSCTLNASRCADRSGHGHDLGLVAGQAAPEAVLDGATGQLELQYSAGDKPEKHTLGLDGTPCLPSPSWDCGSPSLVEEYTLSVVARTPNPSLFTLFNYDYYPDAGTPHRRHLYSQNGRVTFLQAERYGSGDGSRLQLSGPVPPDRTYVATVVASKGGGGTAPGLRLYVDGALMDELPGATVLPTHTLGNLGANGTELGAIAEAIFFERPLNQAELAQLHGYLGARYRVALPTRPNLSLESAPAALAATSSSTCEPLPQDALDAMEQYVACSEACLAGRRSQRGACLQACPSPAASWDKNLDGVVDGVDLELARLETEDAGRLELICYEGGAVVPKAACGAGDCLGTRPENTRDEDCVDADGDGLWAWQERLLGTSDLPNGGVTEACSEQRTCASFDEVCRYAVEVNRRLCLPRCAAPGAGCRCAPGDAGCVETAFHLEEVSQDNGELIVRVHFDHAPAPVNVLDLYLDYESSAMTLTDARPLAALKRSGKELSVRHFSDTQLRLVVLGSANTVPIPTGPLAELVFTRLSSRQTRLGFSKSDYLQQRAMAPDPGPQARLDLTEDARWGADIEVAAAAPGGPRMLLYYSFDNSQRPLDVADVRSGEELCELSSSTYCLGAAQADTPQERVERAERVAQYAALQRGVAQFSEGLPGVSGKGARFDGLSDHLELPVTVAGATDSDGDLLRAAQDFSFSAWLFVDSTRYEGDTPQVLFSHNGANETTVMALLAAPTSAQHFDLQWKVGDVRASGQVHQIASGLSADRWYHVAFTFDEPDSGGLRRPGTVRFYVDGEPQAVTLASGDTADSLALAPGEGFVCPNLVGAADTGARLQLAEEGATPSGASTSPDQIYLASARNNLHGIETMDTTGLAQRTVLRPADASAKDPHYSPVLDKLVYSSNASGDFEIWIANGDGSGARQVTRGFGDTALGVFARRPKWHPNGNGFVFESNVFNVRKGYNKRRSFQLYYVPIDTETGEVAVQYTPGGQTSNELVFDSVREVVDDAPGSLRLTPITATGHHYYRAHWIEGAQDGTGTLICTRADLNYGDPEVARVEVGGAAAGVDRAYPTGFSIVAAAKPIGQDPHPTMLLRQRWVEYEPNDQFEVAVSGSELVVRYTPKGFDPFCWDVNQNGERDDSEAFTEDRNDDRVIDERDCHRYDIDNLYVELFNGVELDGERQADGPAVRTDLPPSKRLDVRQMDTGQGSRARRFLKIDLFSSTDFTPLADRQVIATIRTTGDESTLAGSIAVRRTAKQALYLRRGTATAELALPSYVEEVLDAAFSPEGDRLVLAALENARPVLLTTAPIYQPSGDLAEGFTLAAAQNGLVRWIRADQCQDQAEGDNLFECVNPATGQVDAYHRDADASLRVVGDELLERPALAFEGAGAGRLISAGAAATAAGESWLVVGRRTPLPEGASPGRQALVVSQDGAGAPLGLFVTASDDLSLRWQDADGELHDTPLDVEVATGEPFVVALVRDGASGDVTVQYNGRRVGGAGATAAPGPRAQLGAAGETDALQGNLAEAMIFDRALADEDLAEVYAYLAGRYGVEVQGVAPSGASGLPSFAAPVLRVADSALHKISDAPVAVEGLQWVSVTRTYPCNWVGAFRDPQTKRYLYAFRGGLDEVKLHSYVRSQAAFKSEAERGLERLALSQPNGPDLAGSACSNHFDCPDYQLCVQGTCATQRCTPGVNDPAAEGYCRDGTCTLMPISRDPAAEDVAWVCAAECGNDNQCFSRQCLNGPCRFCSAGDTCAECRVTTNAFGVLTHEGCPDQNSFACVEGSCVTECYAFENGSSQFLCNPGTEYCFQGRCRQFEWTWPDLAPATMSGLGRMGVDGLDETIVKDQLFPVHIWAYGVRDYLHPPEVLVQGRSPNSPYGADWFDLGKILVYHRTEGEATTNAPGQVGPYGMAYTVMTPYELNGLRLLLVQPPYENLANAATGMASLGDPSAGGRDREFCASDAPYNPDDKRGCWQRHSGSESVIGYELGIPRWRADQFEACRDGACGAPPPQYESYLHGGNDAVIITRVAIERDGSARDIFPVGASGLRNTACLYGEQGARRADPPGAPHQRIRTRFAAGAQLFEFDVHDPAHGYGLLNCPYANPETGERAQLELTFDFPAASDMVSGVVRENAGGCVYYTGPGQQITCYEWDSDAVSLDPFAAPMELFRTLEVQDFTGFGYDSCDSGDPSQDPPIPPQRRDCHCPGDEDYDALAGERYAPSGKQTCLPDGSGVWGPCQCPETP